MDDLISFVTIVLVGVGVLAVIARHASPAARRVRRDRKRRLRLGLQVRP